MPNDATRPQPSASRSKAMDFPLIDIPRIVGPVDSLLSVESIRRALLLFPAIAPFRIQTLATEGPELQAKEANRYQKQYRYNPCHRIQAIDPSPVRNAGPRGEPKTSQDASIYSA